ncbi:hypothetical protein BGZ83_010054 [Gryganskiella cystojenkinii]|nr:hypothetical protein BGZ83_010054 [Gryganskiella cystojenkinii]
MRTPTVLLALVLSVLAIQSTVVARPNRGPDIESVGHAPVVAMKRRLADEVDAAQAQNMGMPDSFLYRRHEASVTKDCNCDEHGNKHDKDHEKSSSDHHESDDDGDDDDDNDGDDDDNDDDGDDDDDDKSNSSESGHHDGQHGSGSGSEGQGGDSHGSDSSSSPGDQHQAGDDHGNDEANVPGKQAPNNSEAPTPTVEPTPTVTPPSSATATVGVQPVGTNVTHKPSSATKTVLTSSSYLVASLMSIFVAGYVF